jgi:hypothetical protein
MPSWILQVKQFRDEARTGGNLDAAANQILQQLCSCLIHEGEAGKIKPRSAWPTVAWRAYAQHFSDPRFP